MSALAMTLSLAPCALTSGHTNFDIDPFIPLLCLLCILILYFFFY